MPRARISPPWHPLQRKIGARNARLRRLQRKGLLPPGDKASLRAAAELAAATSTIRKP